MKVAIVGSRHLGKTFGKLLAQAGDAVIFSWCQTQLSIARPRKLDTAHVMPTRLRDGHPVRAEGQGG